jgi:AcrR family transcriptional regulator
MLQTEKTAKKDRRQPSQERSKKRVDAILNAAKTLISEKGSAQLKVHEIASRAGVTAASIYQYFPSKDAITHALAEQTFDRVHQQIQSELPEVTSLDDAFAVLREQVEGYYQLYLADPALYDVWVAISADKRVQDLDLQDSRRTAMLVVACLQPFYPEKLAPSLSRVGFLLAHLSGAAVRMAVSVGEEEGRVVVNSFKAMLSPPFVESMLNAEEA